MLKIKKWMDLSQVIEVSIDSEDIKNCFTTEPIDNSLNASLSLINDVAIVLNGLPDSIINEMSPEQHAVIRGYLLKSAGRFTKVED